MIPSSVPALQSNPFPGLRPYDEVDSHLFFGREEPDSRIAGRSPQLAVLGRSRKFGLRQVVAGACPGSCRPCGTDSWSQRPDAWRIAVMRPGNNPLANLAQSLNAPDVLGREGPEAPLEANLMRAALSSRRLRTRRRANRAAVARGYETPRGRGPVRRVVSLPAGPTRARGS